MTNSRIRTLRFRKKLRPNRQPAAARRPLLDLPNLPHHVNQTFSILVPEFLELGRVRIMDRGLYLHHTRLELFISNHRAQRIGQRLHHRLGRACGGQQPRPDGVLDIIARLFQKWFDKSEQRVKWKRQALCWVNEGLAKVFLMVRKKSQVAKKQRHKLTAEFKARVALVALREDKTMAELLDFSRGPRTTKRATSARTI